MIVRIFYFKIIFLLSVVTSFAQNGEDMFDDSFVHEIRVTFQNSNFFQELESNYQATAFNDEEHIYLMANVVIDGVTVDSIGFREKGFASNIFLNNSVKKPFKIDFNEFVSGKKYNGLKKINLQNGFSDPTMMRDALCYRLMRESGIAAPRTSFAKLYLNDEYWGLYVLVEQINKKFLKSHFEDNDGNLFKSIDFTTMLYQGNSTASYTDEFELKTNETANDWSGFISLIETFNASADVFAAEVEDKFDLDGFLRILAADMLLKHSDSYHNSGRNFYIYSDSTTGKFHWIPWDYNLAISGNTVNLNFGQMAEEAKPLSDNIFANEAFTTRYYDQVCDLMNDKFNSATIEPYLDEWKDLIFTAFDEDPNKLFTTAEFEENFIGTVINPLNNWPIPGVKPFFTNRPQEIETQFSADTNYMCQPTSVVDEILNPNKYYPNPVSDYLTIETPIKAERIQLYTNSGILVLDKRPLSEQTILDLRNLQSGQFVLRIMQNESVQTHKIIVLK